MVPMTAFVSLVMKDYCSTRDRRRRELFGGGRGGQVQPFEGFETLIDLPEADFDSPQAVVETVDSGAEIVDSVVETVDSGAEVVDAVAEVVDSGADHRRDKYAEREGARDDGSDDRLGVPVHEDYCSTRDGRAWGAAGTRASAARMLGAACAVWLGAAGARPAPAETLDRILAVAAGHVIMQSDVRAFVDLQLAGAATGPDQDRTARDEQVLTYLIERRLVLDEVDRYVVADPPAADVERRLAAVTARFRSEGELAAVLARVGYTIDDLRQVLRDDARRDAYVESRFGLGGAAGDERRAAMVAEWVAGLVARGPVMRIRRAPG